MQVLTPLGTMVVEESDVSRFQADEHDLHLKNQFASGSSSSSTLIRDDFFELTSRKLQGKASSSSTATADEDNLGSVSVVEFDFDWIPEIGWGGDDQTRQYSTAGWLAAFPVFEPHYQILVSQGRANGTLRVSTNSMGSADTISDKVWNFQHACVYLEKNWGTRAIPSVTFPVTRPSYSIKPKSRYFTKLLRFIRLRLNSFVSQPEKRVMLDATE